MSAFNREINAYTDGSHSRQEGGYGVVIEMNNRMKKFKSNCYVDTTNNRMEMKGIFFALKQIQPGHRINIWSDSQYCIDSLNKWLRTWIAFDKIYDKANAQLWINIYNEVRRHESGNSYLNFIWLKGHNDHTFNDMADKLANEARLNGKKIVCTDDN